MAITPQTDIRLLKVPFELDNKNQLTFANIQAQSNYFLSVPYIQEDNCSYQRKDNIIRFPAHVDSILNYNYVMYKNEAYTNKWFYAFITNMKYVNNNMTEISIETDVFQTWQFDLIYKKMFVEREHVSNDTVGLHTVPENLETGEYIIDELIRYDEFDDMRFIIQCTEWSNTDVDKPLATNFGGVFMAGGAYICSTINEVISILQAFANRSKSDAVYGVYMCPSYLIDNTSGTLQYSGQTSPTTDSQFIDKPSTLNGYTPINKKLLTFPFCCLNASNNNGTINTYLYELFTPIDEYPNKCIFHIKGVPTVRCFHKMCAC